MDGLKPERYGSRISYAARSALGDRYRTAGTVSFSVLILLLFGLSTDIPATAQTLSYGLSYLDEAILTSLSNLYIEGGLSFGLTVVYSLLGGIALTNMAVQLSSGGVELSGLGGILPGFLAAGCASCGVGLTGFLGIAGATALLPFGGDLVKTAGILLMLYSLYVFGDPEICEISPG